MRRNIFAPCLVLAACSLVASEGQAFALKLSPPALLSDNPLRLLPGVPAPGGLLAQDYDEAFDEGRSPPPDDGAAQPAPRRRNSSPPTAQAQRRQSPPPRSEPAYNYGGSGSVSPMGKQIGVGLQVGAPTALTGKLMLAPNQGLVAGIGAGYGFFFHPALSIHLDYLYHPSILASTNAFTLSWFIGGGAWLGIWDGGRRNRFLVPGYQYNYGTPLLLAVRVPIGLNLAFNELPIELYLEGVPALGIFPAVTFGIGIAAGARFYF